MPPIEIDSTTGQHEQRQPQAGLQPDSLLADNVAINTSIDNGIINLDNQYQNDTSSLKLDAENFALQGKEQKKLTNSISHVGEPLASSSMQSTMQVVNPLSIKKNLFSIDQITPEQISERHKLSQEFGLNPEIVAPQTDYLKTLSTGNQIESSQDFTAWAGKTKDNTALASQYTGEIGEVFKQAWNLAPALYASQEQYDPNSGLLYPEWKKQQEAKLGRIVAGEPVLPQTSYDEFNLADLPISPDNSIGQNIFAGLFPLLGAIKDSTIVRGIESSILEMGYSGIAGPLSFLSDIAPAYGQEGANNQSITAAYNMFSGRRPPNPEEAKEFTDAIISRVKGNYEPGSFGAVISDLATLVPQIVAGALAGPGAYGGLMGLQIFGSNYAEYRAEGVDVGTAASGAILSAAMQAPLEALGARYLPFWKAGGMSKGQKTSYLTRSFLAEPTTEFTQGLVDYAVDSSVYGVSGEKELSQILQWQWNNLGQVLSSSAYQGLLATFFGGMSATANAVSINQARKIRENESNVYQSISALPFKETLPVESADIAAASGVNYNWKVSGSDIVNLYQTRPEIVRKLGITEQEMYNAEDSGGFISIDAANALVQLEQSEYQDIQSIIETIDYPGGSEFSLPDDEYIPIENAYVEEMVNAENAENLAYDQEVKRIEAETEQAIIRVEGLRQEAVTANEHPRQIASAVTQIWSRAAKSFAARSGENASDVLRRWSVSNQSQQEAIEVAYQRSNELSLEERNPLLAMIIEEGGIDTTNLRANWNKETYQELRNGYGYKLFARKGKKSSGKGIAIDEIASMAVERGLLPQGSGVNELLDYLLSGSVDERYNFQYAGSRSIQPTYMKGRFNQALELERAGRDNEYIRQATGWFRGMDNLWRYEIPVTSDMFIMPKNPVSGYTTTLGEIYRNEALYKAYPDMREIAVTFEPRGLEEAEYAGRFKNADGTIDPEHITISTLAENPNQSLVHELQHAIQRREKFAEGLNLTTAIAVDKGYNRRHAQLLASEGELGILLNQFYDYRKKLDKSDLTPDERVEYLNVQKELNDNFKTEFDEFKKIDNALWGAGHINIPMEEFKSHAFYMMSAGEIEANDVMYRIDLTEEERRLRQPSMHEGANVLTGRDKLIIMGVTNLNRQDGLYQSAGNELLGMTSNNPITSEQIITLFNGANLSTILHETGHLFMNEIERIIDSGLADMSLLKDYSELQNWMSVFDDNTRLESEYNKRIRFDPRFEAYDFNELNTEQILAVRQIAKQEYFARGFEKYLLTGEAPALELRNIFQRFRDWLLSLYGSLAKSLDVELNSEVKRIFDSLLSSKIEIDQVSMANDLFNLTESRARELGLTDDDLIKSRELLAQAKASALDSAAQQKELENKERIKQWTAEAEKAVYKNPVYAALREVRKRGTNKFDSEIVKRDFGEEFYKQLLGKFGPGIFKSGTGINSDDIAIEHGFASVNILFNQWLSSPTPRELINAHVSGRKAEFEDNIDPVADLLQTAEASIQAAYIGEQTATLALEKAERAQQTQSERFEQVLSEQKDIAQQRISDLRKNKNTKIEALRQEIRASSGRQREQRQRLLFAATAKISDVHQIAENRIRGMSAGQAIRNKQFLRNAESASRRWAKGLAQGNFQSALLANLDYRMNLELYKIATERKTNLEKSMKRISQYIRKDNKGKTTVLGRFSADYLASRFNLKSPNKVLQQDKGIKDFEKFIADVNALGYPIAIEPDFVYGAPKSWKELSVQTFDNLLSNIQAIVNIDRDSKSIEVNNKKVELNTACTDVRDNILKYRKDKGFADSQKKLGWGQRAIQRMDAFHIKTEFLCRIMDGGQKLGPAWNLIYRPMREAVSKYNNLYKDLSEKIKPVMALYQTGEIEKMQRDMINIPELSITFSKFDLVMMGLNIGNEGNLLRLVRGLNYGRDESLPPITESDCIRIVYNQLEKRDWDFIQGIWNIFESYKQQAFDVEERMNGRRPTEIKPRIVITRDGPIAGGYFPAVYNKDFARAVQKERLEIGGNSISKMTNQGHLQERTEPGAGTPLLLEPGVILRSLDDLITDIAYRENAVNVFKVLNNDIFSKVVRGVFGVDIHNGMIKWLQESVKPNVQKNWSEALFRFARTSATGVAMGFKVTTIAQQPLGLLNGIAEIGLGNILRGFSGVYKPGRFTEIKERHKLIKEKSTFMRDRLNSWDRDVRDSFADFARSEISLQGGVDTILKRARVYSPIRKLRTAQFMPIAATQYYAVDSIIWWGAYEKGLRDFEGDDIKAVQYADMSVRITQGSGDTIDLSEVQLFGGEAGKALTMFMSYFLNLYNMILERFIGFNLDRSPEAFGRLGKDMMLLVIAPAIIGKYIVDNGYWPDEAEDDETALGWAGKSIAAYGFSVSPMTRWLSSPLEGYPISLSSVSRGLKPLQSVFNELGKEETDPQRLARYAILTAGYAGILPGAGQIELTLDNIMNYISGTTEEFEISDLIRRRER